ncbi:MAG: uracil-DNA glycosylase [Planctomycetaceae bacterium]|nr:uracil-DNA glycosylase [Planctomycetaceae bacterium]
MQTGIADYLEIMRLAGVSELRKHARSAVLDAQKTPSAKPERQNMSPANDPPNKIDPPAPNTPAEQSPGIVLSGKAGELQRLAREVAQCTLCKDLATSRTQTVFGSGNPDSPLVFIGEAPGMDEDKHGKPFVGRAGQLLTDIIEKGMKMRREDVYICNVLRCRPPGNRNPLPDEAAHCRPFLDRTLDIIGPKFICCLGAIAAKNLLASEKTIGALRGQVWDYHGIRVVCTYHPAYLLRNPAAKKDTWDDIRLLLREMEG